MGWTGLADPCRDRLASMDANGPRALPAASVNVAPAVRREACGWLAGWLAGRACLPGTIVSPVDGKAAEMINAVQAAAFPWPALV